MGVTITCRKSGDSIDLGGGGFKNLREKVAELSNKEFGEHYALLSLPSVMFLSGPQRKEYFNTYDEATQKFILKRKVSVKIVDFCYQTDCSGRIRFGACKQILKAIGDYDDDILYGYCGRADCAMFKDFKRILQDCVATKSDMIWC